MNGNLSYNYQPTGVHTGVPNTSEVTVGMATKEEKGREHQQAQVSNVLEFDLRCYVCDMTKNILFIAIFPNRDRNTKLVREVCG